MENNTKIKEFLELNKGEFDQWLVHNDQGRVELKVLPYLQDIENGVFVEAGAHDGLFQSNTKILEDLGWTGLLIEPSKSVYEQCKINRTSFVENCALVSFDYQNPLISGNFDGTPRSVVNPNSNIVSNARTLDSLLTEKNIKHVDFLSLDVEGYEIEVLKGINFDTTTFGFMLIEVNYDSYTLEFLENFLLEKGYKNIKNISNFRFDNTPGWPGNHQDYLFVKI